MKNRPNPVELQGSPVPINQVIYFNLNKTLGLQKFQYFYLP
ncbi:hypothetical protein E2C01_040476 [Portunus trituberculatus]|uniref:Uncharacterized protein n=1 Tax=Portunus trituberculatus TaxID=210409 RepID=A0A5B7FHK5_PORTR|nr:hypothetical protein [Portunus trituberculatus]